MEYDFFGLTPEYRQNMMDEIFLIGYYGKGGTTRGEAFKMPVYERRWTMERISEEVEKQFSDERRPLVELVSNAIDAKPLTYEGEYRVQLSLGRKSFEVPDQGNPMTLRQMFTTLIIPFSLTSSNLN